MPFTEFYCRAGGNNLNVGTVDGTTEPSTSPLVTFTGGDSASNAASYTAPVGADLSQVQIGRWLSLYQDGDTVPVSGRFVVAPITNVDTNTRVITLNTSYRSTLGSVIGSGTGNRSARIGGAWAGPGGATGFPFGFVGTFGFDQTKGIACVNLKNDQTYTITANMNTNNSGPMVFQGYSSTPGDGGMATIDGGTTGSSFILLSITAAGVYLVDLIFQNNGNSGSSELVSLSSATYPIMCVRCVFRNSRGHGVYASSPAVFQSCTAYNCNQSNSSTRGGFYGASYVKYRHCVSFNSTGSNTNGFLHDSYYCYFDDCLSFGNGNHGFNVSSSYGAYINGCVSTGN